MHYNYGIFVFISLLERADLCNDLTLQNMLEDRILSAHIDECTNVRNVATGHEPVLEYGVVY